VTGPILTILLLVLLAVGQITAGVYLLAGLGSALVILGIFSLAGAFVVARGTFNA
jgi:hypothetical protein